MQFASHRPCIGTSLREGQRFTAPKLWMQSWSPCSLVPSRLGQQARDRRPFADALVVLEISLHIYVCPEPSVSTFGACRAAVQSGRSLYAMGCMPASKSHELGFATHKCTTAKCGGVFLSIAASAQNDLLPDRPLISRDRSTIHDRDLNAAVTIACIGCDTLGLKWPGSRPSGQSIQVIDLGSSALQGGEASHAAQH